MRREITVAEVLSVTTQRGSVRWVLKDADGNEYSTFREAIGRRLADLKGKRTRIEYHEQSRGQYTNVYLDSAEPVEPARADATATTDTDPEDKLKPFERYVADDIEEHQRARNTGDEDAG